MTGVLGPIANAAHVVGWSVGVAFGCAPVLAIGHAVGRSGSSMGSPSRDPECAGGRRDRRRLHRAGARRGVAADRGRGGRAARVVARAGGGRGPSGWAIPRVYRDLDELLADRAGGGRPRRLAQRAPLRAGAAGAGIGPARDLREAAGDLVGRRPRPCGRWPTRGRRRRRRSTTTSATIPLCHEIRERIASGDWAACSASPARTSRTGCSTPTDYNWRVEPDGRTNLRAVADIGTHWMDLAQFLTGMPIRAVNADLATFHPRRFKPVGPTDTFSGSSGRRLAAGPGGRDHDRRPRRRPPAVRRGRAGAVSRLPGHRRPQEPPDDRDRGHRGLGLPGTASRPTSSGSGRARPQPGPASATRPCSAVRRARSATIPGGHAEGFPDTFKQLYLDVYGWIVAGRAAGRPPEFPDLRRRRPRGPALRGDRPERRRRAMGRGESV